MLASAALRIRIPQPRHPKAHKASTRPGFARRLVHQLEPLVRQHTLNIWYVAYLYLGCVVYFVSESVVFGEQDILSKLLDSMIIRDFSVPKVFEERNYTSLRIYFFVHSESTNPFPKASGRPNVLRQLPGDFAPQRRHPRPNNVGVTLDLRSRSLATPANKPLALQRQIQ